MDKIGLVTITYNSEAFLRPFLNCVFKQTYSNFILYVIDNASVDGTILTLENEAETRLKVIKNPKNLVGDIEVKIIGLRPGEKLYEELLIGDNPQKTYHEKILKAQDPFIPFNQLKIDLDNLSNLLEENRVADVKDILARLVPSYQSNTKIVDHIYEEQLTIKNNLKLSLTVNNQENKVIKIKNKANSKMRSKASRKNVV